MYNPGSDRAKAPKLQLLNPIRIRRFRSFIFIGGNPTTTHESQTTTGKFRIRVLHRLTEGLKANSSTLPWKLRIRRFRSFRTQPLEHLGKS